MQAIVDLNEIENSIKKSVSHLLQNLVEVLRETKGKRKMYVCASLGKFTFYGETFFDNPTMKKIRLELRASTDKHKVSFTKTSSFQKPYWGPFYQSNNYINSKGP